jgi:hypothetical protein
MTIVSLVAASLLVAGCTTPTTRDAVLERYLAAYKDIQDAITNYSVTAWKVNWLNGTSARLHVTTNNGPMAEGHRDATFIIFPTTQDATNYLNAMDKTAYNPTATDINSTQYASGGPYETATGHPPQVYRVYEWDPDPSQFTIHYIAQEDNIISIGTVSVRSLESP